MIRDHKFPNADGGFQAVGGLEVSWRHLGKKPGALTYPLGGIVFDRRALMR